MSTTTPKPPTMLERTKERKVGKHERIAAMLHSLHVTTPQPVFGE